MLTTSNTSKFPKHVRVYYMILSSRSNYSLSPVWELKKKKQNTTQHIESRPPKNPDIYRMNIPQLTEQEMQVERERTCSRSQSYQRQGSNYTQIFLLIPRAHVTAVTCCYANSWQHTER